MFLRRPVIAAAMAVAVAAAIVSGDEAGVIDHQCESQEDLVMFKKQLARCQEGKEAVSNEFAAKEKTMLAKIEALTAEEAKLGKALKTVEEYKKSNSVFETKNKELIAEIASLKAAAEKSKEAAGLKAKVDKLEEEKFELRRQVDLHRAGEERNEIKAKANEARLDKVTKEKAAEIGELKAVHAKLQQQIDSHVSKASETAASNAKIARRLREVEDAHRKLETDLAKKGSVVYSAEQFWTQYRQVKHIFTVFGKMFKIRIVEVLGADNLELLRLQTSVWVRKSTQKIDEITAPVKAKGRQWYHTRGQNIVQPTVAHGRRLLAQGQEFAKEKATGIGRFAESHMDRIVTRLTATDPEVRSLFPDEFWDRVACFAFLFGVFYVLSEIVQWTFSTFVGQPVMWIFGFGRTSKKSGKAKSSKSGSSMSKKTITTTTKPRPTTKTGPIGSVETLSSETEKNIKKLTGSADTVPSETDGKAAKRVGKSRS